MRFRSVMCVIVVVAMGCKEKSTGAREQFATENSCPEEQVDVKPRPDLDAAALLAPQSTSVPSDEVKSDPARLAKWTADQRASRDSWAANYSDYDMFEVTGAATPR